MGTSEKNNSNTKPGTTCWRPQPHGPTGRRGAVIGAHRECPSALASAGLPSRAVLSDTISERGREPFPRATGRPSNAQEPTAAVPAPRWVPASARPHCSGFCIFRASCRRPFPKRLPAPRKRVHEDQGADVSDACDTLGFRRESPSRDGPGLNFLQAAECHPSGPPHLLFPEAV